MTYEDAIDVIVTKNEVRREIGKHSKYTPEIGFEAFIAMYGDNDEYNGVDVLDWLGY